jgi:hypothetical protein
VNFHRRSGFLANAKTAPKKNTIEHFNGVPLIRGLLNDDSDS